MIKTIFTEISPIKRIIDSRIEHTEDLLAVEEPLEIQLRYGPSEAPAKKNISVTMRTPGNDEELAVGFLFTEGIIRDVKQVQSVKAAGNRVLVVLGENEVPRLQGTDRNFYTTSSCGVCGKSSIDAIRTLSPRRHADNKVLVKAEVFLQLEISLREQQAAFESTGGLHASALFDLKGQLTMLREDVGRHNALDKVIGASSLNGQLPLTHAILLLSGRASFELVQKACMAGIAVVAAVGAPSSLAVQLARENNMTLIGFLRKTRLNVYSGWERIITSL